MTANGTRALVPEDVGVSVLSQLTPTEREILKNRIAIGASDAECELFLRQARADGLNPWAMPPEVWLIPRRQQVNGQWVTQYIPQTGKDGALKRAKRRGVYQTHRIEHRVAGQWYDDGDEPDADHPERTRCTIPIPQTDLSVRFVARWGERAQYRADGKLTETWSKMPFEMLAKCALVGALKLLPDAEGIEIADEEFDDEGAARRAFWAWADAQGYDEPTVRRALKLQPGQHLGAFVERYGGWNKARAYLEAVGPSVQSLPEPMAGERASDLLYDNEPLPFAGTQTTASGAAVRSEPENPAPAPSASDEPAVCSYPGCEAEVTQFGSAGEPLCEAHADLAAQEELDEPASPLPAMPESVHDLASFVAAAGTELGASRADLAPLGQLPRGGGREVWAPLWERLAGLMRERQEAQRSLGEG